MRKLIIFAFLALAVTGCKQNNKQADEALVQQIDSLRQVIAQKDNEINDVVGTFNDIEQGFREISEAQGRVTVSQNGEGANAADRIRENMQFIQSTMQQNRELINKLRVQLRESTIKGEELKRTIENLTRLLQEKEAQIEGAREQQEQYERRLSLLQSVLEKRKDEYDAEESGKGGLNDKTKKILIWGGAAAAFVVLLLLGTH